MRWAVVAAALALGGCSISGNPLRDLASAASDSGLTGGLLARDMLAAKFNFDEAIRVGALAPDDPGAGCFARVLGDLGLGADAPSFTPQRAGVLSEGTIVYIRLQQAKKLAGGTGGELPVACKALIGQVAIDGAKLGRRVLSPF